jgi:solute carrier family 12 sodium/potassium/chloride transporter 2
LNECQAELPKQEEEVEAKGPTGKVVKLSWVEGVLMNCLLNIWGVMLFLRVTWVIGQAGLVEGLIIISISNAVTFLTSLSMSAICTNGQITGGGLYYMISRSLGNFAKILAFSNKIKVFNFLKICLGFHFVVIFDWK